MIDFESLPKVVGICGSREFPNKHWVTACVDRLKPDTIVVSGGARGVDSWARQQVVARRNIHEDIHFKEFAVEKFEWEITQKAGFHRNELIVRFLRQYDGFMILFQTQKAFDDASGGTYNDEQWCKSMNVPYLLFTENGLKSFYQYAYGDKAPFWIP